MRILGLCDLITFLIFIYPKSLFLTSTFTKAFSIPQKTSALGEVIILFLFALSGYLMFRQKQSGLVISFILIPLRFVYGYFTLDFLSYLAYYLGFQVYISSGSFQSNWFYFLIALEVLRYSVSAYWYSKLNQQ